MLEHSYENCTKKRIKMHVIRVNSQLVNDLQTARRKLEIFTGHEKSTSAGPWSRHNYRIVNEWRAFYARFARSLRILQDTFIEVRRDRDSLLKLQPDFSRAVPPTRHKHLSLALTASPYGETVRINVRDVSYRNPRISHA